ncbi:MAG TPA: hypothetical protein VKU41_11670, partial [Polyangiaceae bacterium]|nr:hypothetical protein [Polyangiaceae bacterium]
TASFTGILIASLPFRLPSAGQDRGGLIVLHRPRTNGYAGMKSTRTETKQRRIKTEATIAFSTTT